MMLLMRMTGAGHVPFLGRNRRHAAHAKDPDGGFFQLILRLFRQSADGAAIRCAVLALILVPHLPCVRGGERCPAFRRPARMVGGGRMGRAGYFAMHRPIQARGGFGTHWNDLR
jgi:hypothetical protein